ALPDVALPASGATCNRWIRVYPDLAAEFSERDSLCGSPAGSRGRTLSGARGKAARVAVGRRGFRRAPGRMSFQDPRLARRCAACEDFGVAVGVFLRFSHRGDIV